MYRLASKKGSLSSRSIMESVPNAGEFCKQFSGNLYGYCWDDLSDEHQITHKISKITTERGNSFYVTRPDYQLANKIKNEYIKSSSSAHYSGGLRSF